MNAITKLESYCVVRDGCRYESSDGGRLILDGWAYLNACCHAEARLDHRKIPVTMVKRPRPDVCECYPDTVFTDPEPGFTLIVSGLARFADHPDAVLRIRFSAEGQTLPVFSMSLGKLMEEELQEQRRVEYHIDELDLIGDRLWIRGWGAGCDGEVTVSLCGADGGEIPGVEWNSQARPDLHDLIPGRKTYIHGFTAEVPRSMVRQKKIFLVFRSGKGEKTVEINMLRFDLEHTRIGRLMTLFRQNGIRGNLSLLRANGAKQYIGHIREESLNPADHYSFYADAKSVSAKTLKLQKKENLANTPLLSLIIPLDRKISSDDVNRTLTSLRCQVYGRYQIIFTDMDASEDVRDIVIAAAGKDRRILHLWNEEDETLAGAFKKALSEAEGQYAAFVEAGAVLTPDALYETVRVASDRSSPDMIYSDEDHLDQNGKKRSPLFKPDFSPDFARSADYMGHLLFVRRTILTEAGCFAEDLRGAELYDMMLRCIEKTDRVYHIPRVLYHGPADAADETSRDREAFRKALSSHYERQGISCTVTCSGEAPVLESRYEIQGEPLISIIIPNKDHREDLLKCISSIEEKTTYKNIEILIVENNSTEPETFACYQELEDRYSHIRIVRYEGDFNFSAINNLGETFCRGEYLLLLNNDTEVQTPEWLEWLLGCCQREGTGACGARLFYPDQTLQHGGVALGIGGVAGHTDLGCRPWIGGMQNHLMAAREVSAVTAACMMVKREAWQSVGGMDCELAVAFNDVDFCLRLWEKGYKVVYVPQARLTHFESKSRGYETTPEKIRRFQGEIRHFTERHTRILEAGDPYYNPNLTLEKLDCSEGRIYTLQEKTKQ